MVATRKITIETRGPIPQKSGIHGPLTKPYLEDVRVIARMIVGRIQVTEHLENGDTRVLAVKDIPELTAEAPRVIPVNNIVQGEQNQLLKLAEEKKAEALAETQRKLEEVSTTSNKEPEPVHVETPAAPVQEVNVAAMTKAERRAYNANNQRLEEEIEKK